MNLTNEVQTIDEYLTNQQTMQQQVASETDLKVRSTSSKSKKENLSKFKHLPAPEALSKSARTRLEKFLKQSPHYKVLEDQIKLLMEEFKHYKSIGEEEMIEKTEKLINELGEQKSNYIKIFKVKNNQKEKDDFEKKKSESKLLADLKIKRANLEKEFKSLNAVSLYNKIMTYRETLSIIDGETDDVLDASPQEIEEFDDYINEFSLEDETKLSVKQKYYNLCGHIADLLGIMPEEVMEMSSNKLLKILKENQPDLTDLKKEIDLVKLEASTEMNKLSGREDITDIIFNTFDFETDSEEIPKDMLAASNVEFVKKVAYNLCSSKNMLRYFEDAIAYGLLGLTVAINKWYEIQKLADSAITFTGFAHKYVSNNIIKGLYELSSGGRINKNTMATMMHKRNKQIEEYVKMNPELKDLPTEMLDSIIEGTNIKSKLEPTISASDYEGIVGGDEQNGDIWANANPDKDSLADEAFKYEEVARSIKALFSLFETKTDKETGIDKITKKKLFDKYDYKLFKLIFGIELKHGFDDKGNPVKTNYNQTEIGKIMADMFAANGATNVNFSQSAISYRIDTMIKKIKESIVKYPSIKAGFEYLYYNRVDTMNYLYNEDNIVNTQDSEDYENQLQKGIKMQQLNVNEFDSIDDENVADVFENL